MAAIIIAGEDGVLYYISEDQVEASVLDPNDPMHAKAQELVEEGVSHALLPAPKPGGSPGMMMQAAHLLNLGAFRRPRRE